MDRMRIVMAMLVFIVYCAIACVAAYFLNINLLHMYAVFVLHVWHPTFSFEGIKNFLTIHPLFTSRPTLYRVVFTHVVHSFQRRSKHTKSSNERYLLGQNTTCKLNFLLKEDVCHPQSPS